MKVRCPFSSAYFQCSQPEGSRSGSPYSYIIPDLSTQGASSLYGSQGEIGDDSFMNMGSLEQEFGLQHENINLVDDSPPREDSPTLAGCLPDQPITARSAEPGPQGLAPTTEKFLPQAFKQTLQDDALMSYVPPKKGIHLPTFLKLTGKKDKTKEILPLSDEDKPTPAEEVASSTKPLPSRSPSPPRPGPEFPSPPPIEMVQSEYSERVRDDPSHPELQKAARVLGEEVHILRARRDAPYLSRRSRFWRLLVRAY